MQTGAAGSSLISQPSTTGIHSSSSVLSVRMSRVLPWPRSPSSTRSCPASSALSSCGQHGVVEADDAGEGRVTGAEAGEEVLADLLLDRARAVALGRRAPRVVGSGAVVLDVVLDVVVCGAALSVMVSSLCPPPQARTPAYDVRWWGRVVDAPRARGTP